MFTMESGLHVKYINIGVYYNTAGYCHFWQPTYLTVYGL